MCNELEKLEKEKIDQNEYLPATKMSVTALAISSI
jgi:hypothetical protein